MPPKKDYRWQIYHIKGTPAKFIGTVTAPDEETALKKAVAELDIERQDGQSPHDTAYECLFKEGRKPRAYDGDLLHALQFRAHHQTLKITPAMAAGVTSKLWEMADMVKVLEDWETSQNDRR
jgi:hypothetical protein